MTHASMDIGYTCKVMGGVVLLIIVSSLDSDISAGYRDCLIQVVICVFYFHFSDHNDLGHTYIAMVKC